MVVCRDMKRCIHTMTIACVLAPLSARHGDSFESPSTSKVVLRAMVPQRGTCRCYGRAHCADATIREWSARIGQGVFRLSSAFCWQNTEWTLAACTLAATTLSTTTLAMAVDLCKAACGAFTQDHSHDGDDDGLLWLMSRAHSWIPTWTLPGGPRHHRGSERLAWEFDLQRKKGETGSVGGAS